MDRLSGEQRVRPIGGRRGGGQRSQQELLRGASGARQWRGDGEGMGSHALRHIRRPAPHIGPCWLGCPKEVLARGKCPFTQRSATLSDQHIHVNGNLAWEMGQETGEQKMEDGRSPKLDYLVTNVYEKIDGHWFIVSHHVQ